MAVALHKEGVVCGFEFRNSIANASDGCRLYVLYTGGGAGSGGGNGGGEAKEGREARDLT